MPKYFKSLNTTVGLIVFAFAISGCGKDPIPPVPNVSTINGVAFKGPISEGKVMVYAVNQDGAKGRELGTAITAVDGFFRLRLQITLVPYLPS